MVGMKAFVNRIDANGKIRLGTGTDGGMVTPEYQNYANMQRYFLSRLPKGKYRVKAFRNWENRYGTPDFTGEYESV